MKRFWKLASVHAETGGHAIHLDERPLRTPRRAPLLLPTQALAEAVAAEWNGVESEIRPGDMPLSGIANAAVDHVAPDIGGFARALASYAETDLLCYRADRPRALVERQADAWDPILDMLSAAHGLLFRQASGITHVAQAPEMLEKVEHLFARQGNWRLAALQPIVTIGGSALIGLAMTDALIAPRDAYAASILDELWQEEAWGSDSEAVATRQQRERLFLSAARFLDLAAPPR